MVNPCNPFNSIFKNYTRLDDHSMMEDKSKRLNRLMFKVQTLNFILLFQFTPQSIHLS